MLHHGRARGRGQCLFHIYPGIMAAVSVLTMADPAPEAGSAAAAVDLAAELRQLPAAVAPRHNNDSATAAGTELFAFGPGAGIDPSLVGQLRGLTTLTLFHWPPRDGLLAAAQVHGVKLAYAVSCAWPAAGTAGCTSLHSPTARAAFVRNLTALRPAPSGGINIDIEGYSGPPQDLTAFVRELRAALPAPAAVSVDVSALPINAHYARIKYSDGYDYAALAAPGAADFLVVMGYDMEWVQPCSNALGNCSAPALWNPLSVAPLAGLEATVRQFQSLGVRPASLVMALPFYGVDYTCTSSVRGAPCAVYLPWTGPGRRGPPAAWPSCQRDGCPSHLPGGTCPRLAYGPCKGCGRTVRDLLGQVNSTGASYETATASAVLEHFNATQGRRHQVWFDDAHTLAIKSAWARRVGLRGVGVYELGMVNLSGSGMAMWDSVAGPWALGTSGATNRHRKRDESPPAPSSALAELESERLDQ